MSKTVTWTRDEELKLIEKIYKSESINDIAIDMGRSTSAIELRLKKIIYENVSKGKNFETISKGINIDENLVAQYYYSYKEMLEKKNNLNKPQEPSFGGTKQIQNDAIAMSGGGHHKNEKIKKLEDKLDKIELENRILRLIVENKDLTQKLNKLIKEGRVDKSIKNIIKMIRNNKN